MLEATLLALGAAVLHAGWNLLVKTSDERFLTAWAQFLVGRCAPAPGAAVHGAARLGHDPVPARVERRARRVHRARSCARTTTATSRSRTRWPRGGGALLAAIGGVAFLSDELSASVVARDRDRLRRAACRSSARASGLLAIGWALFTALTIGVYTTLDAAGARRTDDGFVYGIVLVDR